MSTQPQYPECEPTSIAHTRIPTSTITTITTTTCTTATTATAAASAAATSLHHLHHLPPPPPPATAGAVGGAAGTADPPSATAAAAAAAAVHCTLDVLACHRQLFDPDRCGRGVGYGCYARHGVTRRAMGMMSAMSMMGMVDMSRGGAEREEKDE